MDGAALQRWVREVLEDVTFRPAPPESAPDVVITTLARAVLRPFAGVVMPGADERQLGALSTGTGWLGQRMREAMGLSTAVQLREAQWEALGLLLTQPGVICLHRCAQGSEALDASPWLARWAQKRVDAVMRGLDPRVSRTMAASPSSSDGEAGSLRGPGSSNLRRNSSAKDLTSKRVSVEPSS